MGLNKNGIKMNTFCGSVGSTVVERMESVKQANRDYNQALDDTITYMYDTVELDY